MKLLAWLKKLLVKDLAEEKPTPFKNLVSREENLVSREEHLEWAKKRANEYIDKGELMNAINSFYSDMSKKPETKDHKFLKIGRKIILSGGLKSQKEVKEFIDGFK